MPDAKQPHLKLVKGGEKPPAKPKGKGGGGPGRGQPPHVPTDQTRLLVGLAKGSGFTDEQIAGVLGVALNTLKAHYKQELTEGADKINLKIAANLASIAASPTHKNAVTAAIYWTKARMGWVDKQPEPEDEDEDEEPMEFTIGIGEKRGPAAS